MQQIAVEMHLMGRIHISVNGAEVVWKTKRVGKLWSVLCLLAVRGRAWVPTEEMARLLWGQKDAAKTRNDVKSAVSHLRRALGGGTAALDEVIEYGNGGYRLGPAVKLTADFAEIGEIGKKLENRTLGADRRLSLCRRLQELYRGEFYWDGCPGWMREHAAALADGFLRHMDRCCAALWQAQRYRDILALRAGLGGAHPVCDDVTVYYFRALHALGRYEQVWREYPAAKRALEARGLAQSRAMAELHGVALLAGQQEAQGARVLDAVKRDLAPQQPRTPRVVDYGSLREICRQSPGRYALAVFTFQLARGGAEGEPLRKAMEELMRLAVECLRGHDLITPYSDNQMLIVMPNHSLESSGQVRQRLQTRLMERLDPAQVRVCAEALAM